MTDKEKQEWQKYFDNKILHAIGSIEYGNYFYEQVKVIADSARNDCNTILAEYKRCGTRTKSQLIKDDLDKRLEEMENELASFIKLELPKIIEAEDEWLDEEIAPFLDIEFDKVRSGLALLAAIPIAHIVSAESFPTNTVNKLRDIYDSILRQSLVTGLPFEETEEDYESRFNTFERNFRTEAETLGSGLPEQYDRIIFTKNDKKISRYMWTAILDTSTCISCGMLDGQIFDSIDKVPMYAQHPNCRCTCVLLPDFVDEKEIRETYLEWFERQNDVTQRKVLGKTRFQLYKQGMGIAQFVNNGIKRPLSELNVLHNNRNLEIQDNKITDYVLNSEKSKGKDVVFKKTLGYTVDNYKDLKDNILSHLKQEDMVFVLEDEYGKRYRNDFAITGPTGNTKVIRTGWIKENGSDNFRLTTVYVR